MTVVIRPVFPNLGTVSDRFTAIQQRIRRNRPMLERMGAYMQAAVQANFDRGGSDQGKWANLSELTVENRIHGASEKERQAIVSRRAKALRRQARGKTLIGSELQILEQTRGGITFGIKAQARIKARVAQVMRGATSTSSVPSHLTDTGKLRGSIRYDVRQRGTSAGTVVVFTNDRRAAALHYGATWTRPGFSAKKGSRIVFSQGGRRVVVPEVGPAHINLPARPFMTIGPVDREVLDRMIWAEMTAAMSGR
jgi:phage gpG-like protein